MAAEVVNIPQPKGDRILNCARPRVSDARRRSVYGRSIKIRGRIAHGECLTLHGQQSAHVPHRLASAASATSKSRPLMNLRVLHKLHCLTYF